MPIRFAAPAGSLRNRMSAVEARAACQMPANDLAGNRASDAMLHAALRHFAEHGLAAARHARKQAESAKAAGDEQDYLWWRDICRALDRRMARTLDHQAVGGV